MNAKASGVTATKRGGDDGGTGGGRPRIPPLNDVVFLAVFGNPGGEEPLMALVNAVLGEIGHELLESIDDVSPDERVPHGAGLKSPHCDIAVVSGGRAVIVEAQLYSVDYEGKATYYAASSLVRRMDSGPDEYYRKVPQTVVAFITRGLRAFPRSQQHATVGRLHWEVDGDYEPGKDRMTFVVCESDKVVAEYNERGMKALDSDLKAWLYVLAEGYKDEQEVRRIMEYLEIPSLATFIERYNLAISDPETLKAYDSCVKDALNYNMILDYAEEQATARGMEKGMAQGMQAGKESERARIISLLESNGASRELIAQI